MTVVASSKDGRRAKTWSLLQKKCLNEDGQVGVGVERAQHVQEERDQVPSHASDEEDVTYTIYNQRN